MRITRKIIVLVISLLITIFTLSTFTLKTYADNKNQTVKVGFFAYPGYHEVTNGVRSGYGYDFLELLRRYTNLNYEYVGYEDKKWEDMLPMLDSGEIDLVTSARKTPEREAKYDFSEPIGTSKGQINVRANDNRFISGDFKALNGKTIGLLEGNSRNADLVSFAAEKGFTYNTVIYDTAEDLDEALQSGLVDAIATSSLRKSIGERTAAEFASQEFYVVVKKGNTNLLEMINYGINQMDAYEGNWRADLDYKNYKASNEAYLSFTPKELDYIEKVKNGEITITVTSQPDLDPYSFVENGKLTGIIPDYFAHLMEMAGLPYTVLVPSSRAEFEEWSKTNHTDIVMDCNYDSSPSTELDFGILTDSYMQFTTSRITRKGFTGKVKTIAAVKNREEVFIEEDLIGYSNVIYKDTEIEAMKAVKNGDADVCYVYAYTAEKFINSDPDGKLQSSILSENSSNGYIYISPNADHELASILNKCIYADSSGELNEIVRHYTSVSLENLTVEQYFRTHPVLIYLAAGLVAVLILLLSFIFINHRAASIREKQMAKEIGRMKQIKGLASQYTVLYFVNLDTLETENYYLDEDNTPDEAKEIDKKSINFFEAFKNSMVVYAEPSFREEMLKLADPQYVKELLADKRRYEYRFPCMNAQGVYAWTDMIIMKFSENENDEAVEIAVGYYNTDDEVREKIEAYERNKRDLEAIKGLAEEYDTLHFVDLDKDTYSMYYLVDYSPEEAKTLADKDKVFSTFHKESMEAFCHPDYMEEMLKFGDIEYIRGIMSKQNKYSYRFLCNSTDGYKWCEITLIRLDKEEEPKRVAIGYMNIENIVKKEQEQKQELTEALEAAELANAAKTSFLFNMSHDIRTPMNAIMGYTDIALNHNSNQEKVYDSLNKIKTAGGHLLNLINDVLEMSRIESGKLELATNPLDLRDIFESIKQMGHTLAASKHIEFITSVTNIKNFYVLSDELHINELLINLLSNAIKYTKEGGRVEFMVEQVSEEKDGFANYQFTVKDNGIGMSEEFQQHIFENFSRENSATVSKQQGAGLGLSIVKKIVDMAHGSINVTSKKNEGSKFTVTLPLRLMDKETEEEFRTRQEMDSILETGNVLKNKKVLLVEDNEMNREIATDILEDTGLIVESASNGELAVKMVDEKGIDYYDFILMDIQMPIMNGYEATRAIRANHPEKRIPIIALSANAFAEDKLASLESGMDDHVAKPIEVHELYDAIKKFIK